MITKEKFLTIVNEGIELMEEIDEPYRIIVFEAYLKTFLGDESKIPDRTTPATTALPKSEVTTQGIPQGVISKLENMTNSDVIMAMLLYENPEMTKEEMVARSSQLGKKIAPN